MQIGRIVDSEIISLGSSNIDYSYVFEARIKYKLFQRDLYSSPPNTFSVPNILSDLRIDIEEIVIDNLIGLS